SRRPCRTTTPRTRPGWAPRTSGAPRWRPTPPAEAAPLLGSALASLLGPRPVGSSAPLVGPTGLAFMTSSPAARRPVRGRGRHRHRYSALGVARGLAGGQSDDRLWPE